MSAPSHFSTSPHSPETSPVVLPQVRIQSLAPGAIGAATQAPAALPPAPSTAPVAPEAAPAEAPLMVRPDPQPRGAPRQPAGGPMRRRNPVVQFWSKIGGGSLTLSLLIHAGILAGAYFMIQTIVTEKKVDFLPGGGGRAGEKASQALAHQIQQKKRSSLQRSMPTRRIVSTSQAAAISLDDLPMDVLDLPEVGSPLGGAMGGAGFARLGAGGGGFGAGQGIGGLKGMAPATFFGKIGGEGLAGTFYDLKQTEERKPLEYNVNEYAAIIARSAERKFLPASMKEYYKAKQQMSFTFLAIPYMSADEGPKAFNVQNEVQPRGWFVHYTGVVNPPVTGEWRFVGNFDDALVVYINNKCVFDGSWLNIGNHGVREPDPEIRQTFGGPPVLTGSQHCWAGKWVRMNGPVKIDIVVGERPGGRVGGLLLVQHRKTKYKERPDGSPILPVFTTTTPDMADVARMKEFAGTPPEFDLELEKIPVFEPRKSLLEEGSALDRFGKKP